jgi:hypothetical protein
MRKQFNNQNAKEFDRFSPANYMLIKSQLTCTCEPYEDIFTLNRWNAQGYKIIKGQKAIKINAYIPIDIKDDKGNITKTITKPKTTCVFCRCQVEEYAKQITA